MVDLAHEFDELSEKVIDLNMCTDHCPCYVAPANTVEDQTHFATAKFHSVSEPYLNLRGRTWNLTTQTRTNESYIPLTWTTDQNIGVTTFE